MITMLAEAQAFIEHQLGRLLTDREAEIFRASIRRAYVSKAAQ
jgi:hypothetical protein